jgi:hypothetical protein
LYRDPPPKSTDSSEARCCARKRVVEFGFANLIWNDFFRSLERDMAAPNRDGPKIEVSKYTKEYVLNDEEVSSLK